MRLLLVLEALALANGSLPDDEGLNMRPTELLVTGGAGQ